jgi:enamine deaminase RidA (YjgF/YER057c/UK114 family)
MASFRTTARRVLPVMMVLSAWTAAEGVSDMQGGRVMNLDSTPPGIYSDAIKADGLIYVSGIQRPEAGGIVEAEARRVLDRLKQVLESAGSSLPQTVSVSVFLKRAADFDAMNAVYREYFTGDLPVRTTVVSDLADGANMQLSAVAVPSGAPREVLHPAGWMKSPRPYAYIVRTGGLVFLSGLVSRRGSDDQVVPGPVAAQTRTILDNAGVLLKTAGLRYEDVVATRVFLTDDSLFDAMNGEYRRYFPNKPPARSTAVTGLMGADAEVEIALVASVSGKQVIGPQISPTLPVSTAVQAGNRIFLSGVLGNTDAKAVDGVPAQTREAFARISRTLEAAGVSFADVVDSTVYLPDIWQRPKFDDVFAEWFPRQPPARTVVGAKLSVRNASVEILISAVKP